MGTIVCKFCGDPATSVVEVAICAKKFTDRRTDRQTDAIALAHWNELIIIIIIIIIIIMQASTCCVPWNQEHISH